MNDNTALEAVQPLYATAISFIVINAIFICLRFYTVLFLRPKRLGLYWDVSDQTPHRVVAQHGHLTHIHLCRIGF